VKANANQLATMIKETGEANSGMTSLMSLVDIDAATIPQSADVSDDSKLILQELHKLSSRLSRVEKPAWVIEASGQKGENKYLYARKLVTKHQDSIREMSEEQLIEFANQCFHEEQIAERNVFLELAARLRAQTGLFW
ncbi:MAG: hypothetical protein OIF57_10530, partial [Marinobacterium sp.]|nr:hypothetical protein [Marinobacterium sp.]